MSAATAERRGAKGGSSAGLVTNPDLQHLPERARHALGELLIFMADSELVIGHRHSEWTGFAPSAEEDVTFSSIAQDEMGHAHLYYGLLTGADDEEAVDRLALDRGPRAFRHLPLLHAPNGDWFFTIARHLYWDTFEDVILHAMRDSQAPLLPSASQRLLNEESYHLEHADEWLTLLSSKPRQRGMLARQLAKATLLAGNPFHSQGPLRVACTAGVIATAAEMSARYSAAVLDRLGAAGWPDNEVAPVRSALTEPHPAPPVPPGLFQLHRQLTGLRRAHRGASW